MPRISGVDIPGAKPLRIALRYIYGIGPKFATVICDEVGVDGQRKANTLTEDESARITHLIDNNYVVEGALRRQIGQDIARLRDIRCYRGDRHRRGLPTRGQRTRTNARTRKGRKKTVAGKKGVKAK